MKGASAIRKIFTKSALTGAALTVLCGLLLWTPLGAAWENASYDSLYHFNPRAVTNRVVLIQMDNTACDALGQTRASWDRALHAQLLNQLAAAGCQLVVFDVLFDEVRDAPTDQKLAAAMRRQPKVVLMAGVNQPKDPGKEILETVLPLPIFLDAATNWGIGKLDASDKIVRRHWPFPAPDTNYPSLPWTAARVAGARLSEAPQEQWLRYYRSHDGWDGGWDAFSYDRALKKLSDKPDDFRGKIVFIGNQPDLSETNSLADTFRTPYGENVGGVEILATTFLNLMQGDWLRRLPAGMEVLLLMLTGILIGGSLCHLKPLQSLLAAIGIFLAVMLVFVSWSYFGDHWFPWLVIAGGQVPCALAWAWVSKTRQVAFSLERFPGYVLVDEKFFGEGAFGKVWRVRNAIGQLQALKEIQRSKFKDAEPYEREFHGIKSYKPVSAQHPGLLHIDFVNCNEPQGYFYYVMELGDALDADWEQKGGTYEPRDLTRVYSQAECGRLPACECIRLGIVLLEALDFLHQQGLVHRDIKPSNIIFVNGLPKLADIGLVREAREGAVEDSTWVGTPDYMPPEPPGTKVGDIYAMGKVLYVISTGHPAKSFPELSTTLVAKSDFMRLNDIFCRACRPAADERYASAAEMLAALRAAQSDLGGGTRRM